MIISLFQKLSLLNWFFATIICLIFFIPLTSNYFFNFSTPHTNNQLIDLFNFFNNYHYIVFFINFFLLFLLLSLTNAYLTLNDLNKRKNYLPLLFSFIFISLFNLYSYFFLTSLFILLLLLALYHLSKAIEDEKKIISFFNASFFTGVLSLLFLPTAIYLLFILALLIIFRIFLIRNWIIIFVGFFLPFLYYFAYLFLTNSLNFISYLNKQKIYSLFTFTYLKEDIYIWAVIGFLTLLGFIKVLNLRKKTKIKSRKIINSLIWFFIVSSIILFIDNKLLYYTAILIISSPIGFFIFNILSNFTEKKFFKYTFDISFVIYLCFKIYFLSTTFFI